MREDTKLARIRRAMRAGNWDEALRLAAKFQRLGEHTEAIQRANAAQGNPAMYEELGYDLAKLKSEGIVALKERFSKSWEEVQDNKLEKGE
jgi:hypothetical protein